MPEMKYDLSIKKSPCNLSNSGNSNMEFSIHESLLNNIFMFFCNYSVVLPQRFRDTEVKLMKIIYTLLGVSVPLWHNYEGE